MTLNPYKLYLINVRYHTVAIIPAKNLYDSINKYTTRTGFANPYAYLSSYLMTNIITFDTGTNIADKYWFIDAITKTIDDGYPLRISSLWVVSCDDIFNQIGPENINNPLLIKPTIKEVRNCDGFDDAPECELRKFCI